MSSSTAQPTPALDRVTWPRRTARLTLRRGLPAHADAIYAYRSREDVGHWLTRIHTDPRAWSTRWAERMSSTVVVEADGRLIGDTRLVIGTAHAQAEILGRTLGVEAELMWAFDPAAHGRGYAREAVGELIAVAFGELGLRRLTARCFAENTASWRLMERLGMRRESHEVASVLHRDGSWRDFYAYALLASEVAGGPGVTGGSRREP